MKTSSIIILLGALVLCSSCGEKVQNETNDTVRSYGNRQAILEENNLSGKVALDTLLGEKHTYGIGPVEGLKGEITIYDDMVSVSTIENERPMVGNAKDTKAIFLIKAHQEDWEEITIDSTLSGLDAIETLVEEALIKKGLNTEIAYPFRIEAKIPSMKYHIIFKTDTLPHDMEQHKRAKRKFALENVPVKIIGFWVNRQRMGKLTHDGKRTHLHFIASDNSTSGHIEDVVIPKSAKLFLPKME